MSEENPLHRPGLPWTYRQGLDQALTNPLSFDRSMYQGLMDNFSSHTLVDKFVIPIRSGRAWELKSTQICRIQILSNPQVGDLNLWSLANPRERMWAAKTRQLESSHLTTFNRIWSSLPFLRPIATILDDSLRSYGVDKDNGRCHDLLGTRCDPYVNSLLTGEDFDLSCHSNLFRAVSGFPHHLAESDVHDVLNVFQVTGLNHKGEYFMKPCPAKRGDHFDFFAEIDLLCALSTCPGGDLSVPLWGDLEKQGSGSEVKPDPCLKVCSPLGVEIYDVSKKGDLLQAWRPPKIAGYRGNHGLKFKQD